MKKIILSLIVLFLFSCKRVNNDNGFYLKKDYLEYQDSLSQKSFELNQTRILLKVSSDTVFNWGDIKYWGEYSITQKFPFRKITHNGNTKYFLDITYNGNSESFEYIKCDSIKPPIDSIGLNFYELEKIKSNRILVGNYSLNGKRVIFNKNGRVQGLNEFKTYSIYFKSGTNFPFSDINLIETNNGIWKFSITKDTLKFIKFSESKNTLTERYYLTNKKIELIRL